MFFSSTFGPMSNDSKQGLVSVAITLRPAAAEVGIRKFNVVPTLSITLSKKWPTSGQSVKDDNCSQQVLNVSSFEKTFLQVILYFAFHFHIAKKTKKKTFCNSPCKGNNPCG